MKGETNENEAQKFVEEVESFSNGKLQSTEDLKRLMEVILKDENPKMLEDLSFSAKYANGLMKIFQDRSNDFDEEYFIKLKKEYTEAIQKVREHIKKVIDNSSTFIQKIFEEKYLGMTHESLSNLNMLINDFSWIKMYLNEKKRDS